MKNNVLKTDDNWDTEKPDPIGDIKREIEEVKNNVGYQPIHPILKARQKKLEEYIKKCVQKYLDNHKRKRL